MPKQKIKSNHPFTKRQLESLLNEINRLEYDPEKEISPTFIDIKVQKSPYVNEIFLTYTDLSNPDYPKIEMSSIDSTGKIDKNVRSNMEFNNLADRVSFFNNLMDVQIDGTSLSDT